MKKASSITKYFYSSAWAIESGYLGVMEQALDSWKAGEDIEAPSEAPRTYEVINAVAVLRYSGSFHKRLSGLNAMSGGISGSQMVQELQAASRDDAIKGIVLSLDTPGGTVDGVTEVAQAIKDAKSLKPVVTFADGLMASAGVWLGVTSDAVVAGETTQVGSIGVIMVHQEDSKASSESGVTSTVLTAGRYKGDGNRYEPLTDQARDNIQASLDYYYSMFVDHVAESRSMTIADTLASVAEGRMFIGNQAVGAGLVDKIGNLETAIQLTLSLGGYNVKKELKEALVTMESDELLACLADANLPAGVKESIEASLHVEEEVTITKVEHEALVADLTSATSTIVTLETSLVDATSQVSTLEATIEAMKTSEGEATARDSIVSQFTAVGYEASDELIASLLEMSDPSVVIESTIALHQNKESLAENLNIPTGLADSNDAEIPKTIDAAVALVSAEDKSLDIDAAIKAAATKYPEIFNK